MKNLIATKTLLAIMALAIAGCSSIRSRYDTPEENWTVYPGIQQDSKDLVRTFSGQIDPLWTSALVAPVLLMDVPFSLVTDTIALPYDLYEISQEPARIETTSTKADH